MKKTKIINQASKFIKKINYEIKHKNAIFATISSLLIVLIVILYITLLENDSIIYKGYTALESCFLFVVGTLAFLIEAKRSHIKPKSVFYQNAVKRWYYHKKKPEKYSELCFRGFYFCLVAAFASVIFFVVKHFF